MDRDAVPAESVADAEPPYEWLLVRKIGFVGLGMIAGAAVLGLVATAMGSPPWVLHTARLFLVFVGALTVGSAVSMRADLWQTWAIGAGAGLLAVGGTPAHWDSFRLLFGAFTAVAGAWVLVLLVPRYRMAVISAVLAFHFSGIFFATTTPPSTPWVTEQAYVRVYNPYLQLIYMRNAYHFYSPEPGPASVIVCLLKTESTDEQGRKKYDTRWYVIPKRPNDVKDPLGLTYYRYLSITEQLARVSPGLLQPSNTAEKTELSLRREAASRSIPFGPGEERLSQYRLPQLEVARFVLPSYASHIILENTDNKVSASKTTVKIYRLEHRTLSVEEFANPRNRPNAVTSPYHPSTYRPFFLGEYGFVENPDKPGTLHAELLYPQERMLYWLIPIVPRPGGVSDRLNPHRREFIDYLSIHALDTLNLSETDVDDPQYRDRVFDWNQLR